MTDNQTPPDWVILEAAKRWGFLIPESNLDFYTRHGGFRALCYMIERYEQPPVDRKLLCAHEAAKEYGYDWGGSAEYACRRAIELWEEGFGK